MHVVFNIVTLTFLMCPVSVRHHIVRDELQIQVSPPQSMRAVDRCTIIWPAMRARRWTSGTSWRGLQRSPEVTGSTISQVDVWEQHCHCNEWFFGNSCLSCFALSAGIVVISHSVLQKIIIAMISYTYLMFVQYNHLKYFAVIAVSVFLLVCCSLYSLYCGDTGIWTKFNHPSSLSANPNNITLR